MEPTRPEKRKRGRPALKTDQDRLANTVKIEEGIAGKLDAYCKKMKVPKGRFTSAALRYFIDNGLDPTKQIGAPEGTLTRQFLNYSIMQGRQEHMDVGNRIVKIMRVWERDLYKFLASHQTSLVHYLERIEVSLLNQMLTMETRALSTIIERIVSTELEAHMTRVMTERILAKLFGEPESEAKATTKLYDREHDQQLLKRLQELMQKTAVTRPTVATKASPTPIPEPPAKTKPGTAAAGESTLS